MPLASGVVIVTLDSDFTTLLALRQASGPSIVFVRDVGTKTWDVHLRLFLDNLANIAEDLTAGAVVSLSPTRISIRRLPIVSTNQT